MMAESVPKRIGLSDMDTSKYLTFGSLFIIAVDTSLFPLDTIKTIIMSEKTKKTTRKSLFRLAATIARKEGIVRFWRGVVPSTIGNFPGQAAYYLAYESSQEALGTVFKRDTKFSTFMKGFFSGMAAEVAGGIFYVPSDIVAQRLQIQSVHGFVHNSRLYTGPVDVVKKILKLDGIGGLYRGYVAYVTAYAPGSAVQWGSYELSKGYMFRSLSWLEKQNYIPNHIPMKEQVVTALSAGNNVLISGVSSICAIASNNPLEILRIRTQLLESKSKADLLMLKGGYFHLAQSIWKEEGWRAFYRGLKIRLVVTVPSAIVALSGYEVIKQASTF